MRRREAGEPAPLSFAQQRLWFLNQFAPDSAEYILPFPLRVTGPLDLPALERALTALVERHEVLRTRLVVDAEGDPEQLVDDPWTVSVPVVDLTGVAGAELRESMGRDAIEKEIGKPFDLAGGPLLRALLVRLGAGDSLLLLCFHHVVADGWSLGILSRELGVLYADPAAVLPVLPVSYRDFAVWERDWSRGDVFQRGLEFWRGQLAGLEALDLPLDRARPAVRTGAGGEVGFVVSPEVVKEFQGLVRRAGVTPFMGLLSVFQVLLSRYSGQNDVAVGTPVANRGRVEVEGLIGFFVNTLVLRGDLAGDPSVNELFGRVRDRVVGAFAHQDFPFERLVEELAPERDLSRTPLIQAMFVLQNTEPADWALPGLDVSAVDRGTSASPFDVTLQVTEVGDSFRCELQYNSDVFDRGTIERMACHFERLLRSATENPDARVSALQMLSDEERHRLVVAWNDTDVPYEDGVTLHQLVERQVAATPGGVAVTYGAESLTYAELNSRANRLAHLLRDRGVGPETIVGLCVERDLDTIVTLLAVLKAGGAYFAMDPGLPAERLAFMIGDTAAPIVFTQTALLDRLPATGAELICVDDLPELGPDTDPVPLATADNIAYVVYTSGSTGVPKGIMIEHRSLCALRDANWHGTMAPDDVVAQSSSLSWDMSAFEIWGALTVGARLVIVSHTTKLNPVRLRAELETHGVTVLGMTSPLFNQHLAEFPELVAGLKMVEYGGEAVERSVADRLAAGPYAPANISHAYGPCEHFGVATHHRVTTGSPAHTLYQSIGRPCANTEAFVLDGAGGLVPVGVVGELWIGGLGLARGYLNRAELTAERFVVREIDGVDRRLYRTGDLVRWTADGYLDFLGRSDDQVKVRGFRIELGEIEAALADCPGVGATVVAVREDVPGDKRLVAYVVPADGPLPGVSAMRAFLHQRLPEYMVPGAFVELASLPLTTTGKVDRRALPAPDTGRPELDAEYAAPRTEIEAVLVRIWAEVLGVDRIGVHDDFFDLGGHSLLATRVAGRAARELGIAIPVRQLFDAPTVATFAGKVRTGTEEIVPALRRGVDGPAPLSFAQQRLWFLDQFEPGSAEYLLATAVRLRGPLGLPALKRALRALAERHEVLRTRLVADADGVATQIVDPVAEVPFDLSDLPGADIGEVAVLLERMAGEPMDLGRGPLFRAALVRLGAGDAVLLLRVHHVVADGWSLGILSRELGVLYADPAAVLPVLPVSYRDFAVWERGWLRGDVFDRGLEFWRGELTGVEALELPLDRARPAVRTGAGGVVGFDISGAVVEEFRGLVRRAGVTPFMGLLSVFQVLLSRYSGQNDVAVGTPVANRGRVEVEGLIGFFVNTLVLRGDLAGDPSVNELFGRVRDRVVGAFAHQDFPFERLVEELAPERDLSRTPLFQAMFVLQNMDPADWALPGLDVSAVPMNEHISPFDVSLQVTEDGDVLRCELEYNSDVFDRATIERMACHFERLLRSATENPDARVSALQLLSDEERHRLAVEWNDPAVALDDRAMVHHLVEERVLRSPGAVAVTYGAESLTYAELNSRANRLAHLLRDRGVGPEVLVAVCVDRGPDMIVSLLAVLKAGGAYVPMDAAYPAERLAFLFQDTATAFVLTQRHLSGLLPDTGAELIHVDEVPAEWPDTNPAPLAGPDDLAYVIYTSGSTGVPKGVMIEHRAFAGRMVDLARKFGLTADDRVLQFASVCFDVSVEEIFPALMTGSALVLRRDGWEPAEIVDLIRTERVTTVELSPSAWAEMLPYLEDGEGFGPQLRFLNLGGEQVNPSMLDRWFAHRDLPLHNTYGPTEATVTCTAAMITGPVRQVPIGRPCANTEVFVLDATGGLVPVGVVGELWVGGVGLARGYLNRPELTAERFVVREIENDLRRLYRTGDLVRWNAGGELEFVGRTDDQVKVRGFRIELGEIEAALAGCPGVSAAVVTVREDVPGDRRLIGYVVPDGSETVGVSTLRASLKRLLPEHMIPGGYVVLDTLPLNTSGKVDRRALPAPAAGRPELDAEYTAPRTAAEAALAEVWADVLGIEKVGVHDNFFELGGHSILSIQVVHRARRHGLRLSPRMIFQAPTVAGVLGGDGPAGPRDDRAGTLVELGGPPTARTLYCLHENTGTVQNYAEIAAALAPGLRVVGVEASLAGTDPGWRDDLTVVAAAYWELIRAETPAGPYLLAGWSFGSALAFEVARQIEEAGQTVELLVVLDGSLPTPISRPVYAADENDVAAVLARVRATTVDRWPALAGSPEFAAAVRRADLPVSLLALGRDEMAEQLEIRRVHDRAYARYAPSPVRTRVLLLRARESDWPFPLRDGWAGYVGAVDQHVLDGDHHTLLTGANAVAVGRRITAAIESGENR
ncbi:hypothetical protein GCM10009828_031070 [Actinoplanes couchii]